MANRRTSAQWRKYVSEQAASGLSVREYCSQHQLPAPQFYNQRSRYSKQPKDFITASRWIFESLCDRRQSTTAFR